MLNKRGRADNFVASDMLTKVLGCGAWLQSMATRDGITIEAAAEKVLSRSPDELTAYITSKGETPVDTMSGKILQAALLRMEDIAIVARASGISDEAALSQILEAESEAVALNTAERGKILTPSSQASLMIVYKNLLQKMAPLGVSNMGDALDNIRTFLSTPKNHTPGGVSMGSVADNFDLGDVFGPPPSSGAATASGSGSLGGVYSEDVSPVPNGGDSTTSVFGLINNVIGGLKGVNGALGSIGATVNGIGGGIGASAIDQYLSQNGWKLVIGVIVLAILIIIIARVANRK